jgi:uncharacterized coiled-coil protein SlyX
MAQHGAHDGEEAQERNGRSRWWFALGGFALGCAGLVGQFGANYVAFSTQLARQELGNENRARVLEEVSRAVAEATRTIARLDAEGDATTKRFDRVQASLEMELRRLGEATGRLTDRVAVLEGELHEPAPRGRRSGAAPHRLEGWPSHVPAPPVPRPPAPPQPIQAPAPPTPPSLDDGANAAAAPRLSEKGPNP